MRLAKFVPQPDITTYELALVIQVFIGAQTRSIDNPAIVFMGTENSNFDRFIEDYSPIQRHFEITEEENDKQWWEL